MIKSSLNDNDSCLKSSEAKFRVHPNNAMIAVYSKTEFLGKYTELQEYSKSQQ